MNKKIIEKMLSDNGFYKPTKIKKIDIWFINQVYSIDDQYILKICTNKKNEANFLKELFLYEFFEHKLPVPKVILFDRSKDICNKDFMVYPKIIGHNLYSKWHLMTEKERRKIVKELCHMLKIINEVNYDEYLKEFNISEKINWKNEVDSKIKKYLEEIENKQTLSNTFIQKIKEYVELNINVLQVQKIALVHWDTHFDNILVKDNKIVWILDFERINLASIDYVLEIFKRMVDHPSKYMSEESEKFCKKEDYEKLLVWIKEFYPELFEFKDLEKRLDLYSIQYDLKLLLSFPNVIELKQQIAKIVKYGNPNF